MPARVSESLILRTYPLQESDLIVSFLARDAGKMRGVAKRARRPKSRFGAGLERLSHVRMFYYQRENRELVSLDTCELIRSPFDLQSDYGAVVGMDFISEVTEQLLPAAEPNERHFRLVLAAMDHMRAAPGTGFWAAVTYFAFWAVRLGGFLPDLRLSRESLELAAEMMQLPIGRLSPREWSKNTAADLRRALVRTIEEHIERRVVTAQYLESL
jgi:DNA repair protein RecO (recombination protein O)